MDTLTLERSPDSKSINLAFDTTSATDCSLGFVLASDPVKTPKTYTGCAGKSATKFSETLTGIPADQLVTIIIRAWPSSRGAQASSIVTIDESPPSADGESIHLLLVDLNAGRLELTSVKDGSSPSRLISNSLPGTSDCQLSDKKSPGFSFVRKSLFLQGATSKGFINLATTRVSPTTFGGNFKVYQKESGEWRLSAKSNTGSGQLRINKPALLSTVTFAGRDQVQGSEDELEDVDPPGLRLDANSSLVATWTLAGESKSGLVTLTVAPVGAFPGITCQSPASSGKITVPANLVASIPTSVRLWATLRLDSFQAMDKERWLVRVSDWRSTGVQRQ